MKKLSFEWMEQENREEERNKNKEKKLLRFINFFYFILFYSFWKPIKRSSQTGIKLFVQQGMNKKIIRTLVLVQMMKKRSP